MKEEILLALSLGDGHISRDSNKYGQNFLHIRHSHHQKEYINYKYNLDKFFWRTEPKRYNNKIKNKKYYGYQIRSKWKHELSDLRKLLYPKNTKTFRREILERLTPEGLAYWYMDDGCIDRPVKKNSMGILNTFCNSANAEEEKVIQQYFREKWNIRTNINRQKDKYRLRFPHKEFCRFVEIINPFVIDSMKYKTNTKMRLNALDRP